MSAVAADAALTRGGGDFDWPWAAVCDHLFLRLSWLSGSSIVFVIRGQTCTGVNADLLLIQ